MTMGDIILWLLASIGGLGTIVEWLGKRNIASHQSQLDIDKTITLRYSDKQFDFYNKLWSSLYDLKLSGDELWQEANHSNFKKFSKQLKITIIDIEKASLFIEDAHYKELKTILSHFSEYKIGKEGLIYDCQAQSHDNNFAQDMISHNEENKSKYEDLIEKIKIDLKKQLKGYV